MFCCTLRAAGQGHSPECGSNTPGCRNHKIIAHDQAGVERWCDACGRDEAGFTRRTPAGGWGTPK